MSDFFTRTAIIVTAAIALLCSTKALSQEIYKSVDKDGNVVYSDTPISDGSEELDLPNLNIEPGVVPRVRISPQEPQGPVPINAWIASPENDFVVHQGALSFSVAGATNRSLESTEWAQLLVNGQAEGERRKNLSWTVGNLIRGEYTLQLQIFRENELAFTSGSTTIFVRRAFVR